MRTTALSILVACAACNQENAFYEQDGSDTWLQAASERVDILFVVDESCSMVDEQATLAAGFSSFAGQLELSATDFHLGVISTSFDDGDPDRGKLLGEPSYLTPQTPDYAALFSQRAQVGTDGADKEKGLQAAQYALSPAAASANAGFVRTDARLLVVYVSDEEDCSDEGALDGLDQGWCSEEEMLVPVAAYIQQLRAMKSEPADVQAAAIIGLEGEVCQNVQPSRRYRDVAELLGGQLGNICDGNWSPVLTRLGLNAAGVFGSFQLSHGAAPASIEVYVDDELVPPGEIDGWTYDPATWYITLHGAALPELGDVIVANYAIAPGQPPPPGL